MITSSNFALHHSIVSKLIRCFSNICLLKYQHQNQHQTIRHIRSVNHQFARFVAIFLYLISYCNLICTWLTNCLHWLQIISIIVAVNSINSLIYLFHQASNSVQKWMTIHQLSVFLFCETSTSTIRHFKRAYLSIIEQKISHSHLHASVTNDDKMNDSKHFFFYLSSSSIFHFIRNFITRYLLYLLIYSLQLARLSARWHQFVDYCTFVASVH